jgi:inner membrane protein
MESTLQSTLRTAWQKSKWIIKGLMIGFLALLLMIPMYYVKELIREREARQKEVAREISSKWAGPQNIIGPVIGLPYLKTEATDTSDGKNTRKHTAFFLPDRLDIKASVAPKEKHRGIYKVMLYESKVDISGSFNGLPLDKLNIRPEQVLWNEAFVMMDIADSKGLNDQLLLNWNDSIVELSPATEETEKGMISLLKTNGPADFQNISFKTRINLNGSEQLVFTPTGKLTTVTVESPWQHPSFSGQTLPLNSSIGKNGFTAEWKSMAHKRNFPQQWTDNTVKLDHYFPAPGLSAEVMVDRSYYTGNGYSSPSVSASSAAFGVDLFIPVNGYQKAMRTIKYALLCILLTFAAFFLIETTQKKSVHPFQYGLVGLALVLFYTLLLSVSEYTGFNTAYVIASLATIGLITWFVKGIMSSGKAASILSVVLFLIYSYIFSLLQLQDYSLLLGSIGLFLSLAVVMYFSRKLQW